MAHKPMVLLLVRGAVNTQNDRCEKSSKFKSDPLIRPVHLCVLRGAEQGVTRRLPAGKANKCGWSKIFDFAGVNQRTGDLDIN